MMENKYRKMLTIILSVVAAGVFGLLGFLAYDVYEKYAIQKANADIIERFDESVQNKENTETNTDVTNNEEIPVINVIDTGNNNNNSNNTSNSGNSKVTYNGYNVVGKIEIPSISLSYPILESTTPDSIELAVSVLYGPGPNKVGNTTIVGHNYRNGSFFGNNDKLVLGDKIYITDESGTRLKYNIYNIYETTPDDSDFITRDTAGKREISLSTCTDNSKARLIIWAVEEQ